MLTQLCAGVPIARTSHGMEIEHMAMGSRRSSPASESLHQATLYLKTTSRLIMASTALSRMITTSPRLISNRSARFD